MNTNELLSVIVPIYNVEKYLDKCVESIVNQTYRNLEIILIDDGSTDRSGTVCDNWGQKDSRIIVLHTENCGVSAARNIGVEKANGAYITFVDSDDFIHPKMYEHLLGQMNGYNADMVICYYDSFRDGDLIDVKSELINKTRILSPMESLNIMYGTAMERSIMNLVWNKLYRKEIFSEVRYPIGRIYEDAAVIPYILKLCNTIVLDDNVLVYHRIRENSIIESIASDKYTLKRLDGLENRRNRVVFYNELEDPKLLYLICTDYFEDAIAQYVNVMYYIKDKETKKRVCKNIYSDFCKLYKQNIDKINISIKKRIKYNLFYRHKNICALCMFVVQKKRGYI